MIGLTSIYSVLSISQNFMKKLMVYALLASLCVGCMSTTSTGAGAGRKQFIIVTEHYVDTRGDKIYQKLSEQADPHQYLAEDERLVKLMNQLIPYAEEYLDQDETVDWAIHVWDAKRINSKALGNGTVLIAEQYLENNDLNDEELALLIAHEMAHIIRRHPQEFYSWKYLLSPVLMASSFLTSGATSIVASAGQDVYGIGFKHSAEKEADLLGLEIYAKAGFNPKNALNLMQKIKPLYDKDHPVAAKLPNWVQSQRSFKSRERSLLKYQEKVQKMYLQHIPKHSEHLIDWDFEQHEHIAHQQIAKLSQGFHYLN